MFESVENQINFVMSIVMYLNKLRAVRSLLRKIVMEYIKLSV